MRRKKLQPFKITLKSFLGIAQIVFGGIIESFLVKKKLKQPKEDLVTQLVKSKAQQTPDSVLRVIDDYGWKKKFLMNIGNIKGEILQKTIQEKKPKNVLELGVYLGYSSISICKNLDQEGFLTSIEINPKFKELALKNITHAKLEHKIKIKIGKASEVIPSLTDKFDFVFIDHWKDSYLSDLKLLEKEKKLNKGALIFADNVVLFHLEEYLSYVRNSQKYDSKFIPTLREYSKTQPDGIEISIFKE